MLREWTILALIGAFFYTWHPYVAEGKATYYVTVLERGADRMMETGLLQPETAAALKAEEIHYRRRSLD